MRAHGLKPEGLRCCKHFAFVFLQQDDRDSRFQSHANTQTQTAAVAWAKWDDARCVAERSLWLACASSNVIRQPHELRVQ